MLGGVKLVVCWSQSRQMSLNATIRRALGCEKLVVVEVYEADELAESR